MLIDWFTVVAQIVNFLILVALMKHFLYGPLVRAIDAREKRIAAQLAEADQKEQGGRRGKPSRCRDSFRRWRAAARQMIEEARKRRRTSSGMSWFKAARDSVRALEAKWREDLRREERPSSDEVRRAAAAEILSITRRALADLASADLEQSAIRSFLENCNPWTPCVLRELCGRRTLRS